MPVDPDAPLLLPRSSLQPLAQPITAIGVLFALVYLALAFQVRDPERALVTHAAALACGVAVVVATAGEAPDLASLRAHCARELSDYKAPDALVLVDELPLTPMMKVDPVRLAGLAALGAEERRQALERSRRSDAGVLGNGPTGEADEKERA